MYPRVCKKRRLTVHTIKNECLLYSMDILKIVCVYIVFTTNYKYFKKAYELMFSFQSVTYVIA